MLIWILLAILLVGVILWLFIKKKNKELANQKALENKTLGDYVENLELLHQFRFNNYLEVFKDRLLTLEDDKSITFQEAGIIELKIFYENTNQLIEKIRAEENEKLNLNNHNASLRLDLDNSLNNFLNKANTTLQQYGMKLFEEKVLEIANSKPEGL